MRTLSCLCVAVCLCLVPVASLASNAHPALYLEIYALGYDVPDSGEASQYVCVHPSGPPIVEIPCYSAKAPNSMGIVAIHVGQLDYPLAPNEPCAGPPGGGYRAISLGVSRTGAYCTFAGFTSCPGFLTGPSTAGHPAAILTASISGCHGWTDHPGYLWYLSNDDVGASYFDIVTSADNGPDEDWVRVINCQCAYDIGTVIGGGAQWGGTKTITCAIEANATAVEETTWGKIKGFYR